MKRCTRCVMPDTRPGIKFDSNGVCAACLAYDRRKDVDWTDRDRELAALCDEHRLGRGYDCIIAVSGGKDSHYQVHVMKELMNMHPLLVTVSDNFPMTKAGEHNIQNISRAFGCDILAFKPDIAAQIAIGRYTFERYGKPTYYTDRYIYTYPLWIAYIMNIPLVVYGENIAYEYSGDGVETPDASEQIMNGVASGITQPEITKAYALSPMPFFDPPFMSYLQPIYLSYYVPWNSWENYRFAASRGFKTLDGEWERTMCVENWNQIDSAAYLVHPWLKYPKFGHSMATDISSRLVRYGIITRAEAMDLVRSRDGKLDEKCVDDFCEFYRYTRMQFWAIVNKFYNKNLFTRLELTDHSIRGGLFYEWILKEES